VIRYRGYFILAAAVAVRPDSHEWRSQGTVCRRARDDSIKQIKLLEGGVFKTVQAAEEEGVELCKKWIDANSKEAL
jgi:hypothetical protein